MDTAKTEITRLLSADELTKSDAINLMSQLRVCLETESLKNQYPYLTMYCDWTVHPQLSRSAPAFQIIESIADALVDHPNAPDSPGFFDDITKAFHFDKFRADCIKALKQFGIPETFCSNQVIWDRFLVLLISILLERPLEFPDSKKLTRIAEPIYHRIQKKWVGTFKNTLGIRKVSFINGTGEHNGTVLWKLELILNPTCPSKSATLQGPLKKP